MIGHGSKFGRKKEEAIAALLTQQTIENAARSIGIGVSTLLRWQKDPEFDAGYRAAQRAAYRQTTARLQQASPAAATVLTKLMVDSNTPASVRARTADSVLSHAAKAIEIQDLEARVAELERATEASKPGQARGNR
jgi:transposase-like protein